MRQLIRAGTTAADSDTGQQFANKINAMTEELYAGVNDSIQNWLGSRPPIPNCNNTALDPGYHRTDINTQNAPERAEGALFMLTISGDRVKQIWYGPNNTRYERGHMNGTWSAWVLGDLRIGELETVTFNNVPLNGLQGVINSLPKQLNQNYVINASPGNVNLSLSIRNFSGPGTLHIRGALSRNTLTHRVTGVTVSHVSCSRVIVDGFTVNTSFDATHCTSEIMFNMCNAAGASPTGIFTNWCSMVNVWACTLSNKDAAVWGSTSLIRVNDCAGAGNGILYAAANAGIICIVASGTIQLARTGNFAHCTNGGVVYDHFGRPFHGMGGAGGTGLTPAENISVTIADLRTFLRSRSRYLSGNLTITVSGGTTTDVIEITGFYGPGILTINGSASANLQTHVVQGFTISNCHVGFQINGFTTTATAIAAFTVTRSPVWSEINNCHIRAGTGAAGIVAGHGSNIQIAGTVINGRSIAIHAHNNSIVDVAGNVAGNVTGTGNSVALYVTNGSVVRSRIALGMDGGVFFSNGGYAVIGSDNLSPRDGQFDLGSVGQRWRTLFTTSGTVNSSDEREKTDIAPLPDNLQDFFMRLNPVSYKRVDEESGEVHWGLIAQDVEKAVQESADSGEVQRLNRSETSPFNNFAGVVKAPVVEVVDSGEVKETRVPVRRYETKVREVPVTRMVSVDEYEELLLNSAVRFSAHPNVELGGIGADRVSSDMAPFDTAPFDTASFDAGSFDRVSAELFEVSYTEMVEYTEEVDGFEIETEPIMEERVVGDRYGIRYSEFVPMLIKMVQMQQGEIEALKLANADKAKK